MREKEGRQIEQDAPNFIQQVYIKSVKGNRKEAKGFKGDSIVNSSYNSGVKNIYYKFRDHAVAEN